LNLSQTFVACLLLNPNKIMSQACPVLSPSRRLDKLLLSYKTTGKIVILYTLNFMFLGKGRTDNILNFIIARNVIA
jgi:hypothetical protein